MRVECVAAVMLTSAVLGACGGAAIAVPRAPAADAPGTPTAVQTLYEAGHYQEVLDRAATTAPLQERDVWFAAASAVHLNRVPEARAWLERLTSGTDGAWQVVGRVALARLTGPGPDLDRALAETLAYPTHPFVQLERGLGHMARREYAEAAAAFDRSLAAEPRLAYAYYYAALAYEALDASAMMASRLETFVRLAPQAPEVPEARAILNSAL